MTEEVDLRHSTQVLTIEKLIKLLSAYHLEELKKYLASANAHLPLKLVNTINPDIMVYQGNEALCSGVYGKCDKQTRQSFNQLASYTLKLTAFLARNFPAYLAHNIDKPEILINEGKIEQAVVQAELMLDIANKVEDFKSEIRALLFLSQYSYITNAPGEGLRLQKKLNEAIEKEHILNNIVLYFKTYINISVRENDLGEDLKKHLTFFQQYLKHDAFSIAAMARYFTLYIHYYYNAEYFYSEENLKNLADFEDDLTKYGYIVLPYFLDMPSKLIQFRLNRPDFDANSKEGKKEIEKLLRNNKYFQYWKYFSNLPELYALNVKATSYLANYHHTLHHPKPEALIPAEFIKDIREWIERAENLHKNTLWTKTNIIELIHLRLNYSALLLLGTVEQRKKAISLIEETLISYQQLQFSESIDSFYTCLMIGYFSLKEYEKCASTYKRYIKLAQGRKINADNDLLINTYYYASQWFLTARKQYPQKLAACYELSLSSDFYKVARKTIADIIEMYNIPVKL